MGYEIWGGIGEDRMLEGSDVNVIFGGGEDDGMHVKYSVFLCGGYMNFTII